MAEEKEKELDLEAMEDALDREIAAGATNPTGYVGPTPSARMNPYLSEEDQGMEMKPVIVGPPQYGSPNPETAAGRLVPLEEHPLRELPEGHPAAISPDFGKESVAAAAAEEVNATEAAKELAADNDVNLAEVEGTGENGRVTKADVENYLAEREAD